MVLKYSKSASLESNYQVINEILELYRFIVEKYAGYNAVGPNGEIAGSITIICELAVFLDGFWQQFRADVE